MVLSISFTRCICSCCRLGRSDPFITDSVGGSNMFSGKKFYQNMLLDSAFLPSKTGCKNNLLSLTVLSFWLRKGKGTAEHSRMKKKINRLLLIKMLDLYLHIYYISFPSNFWVFFFFFLFSFCFLFSMYTGLLRVWICVVDFSFTCHLFWVLAACRRIILPAGHLGFSTCRLFWLQ